MPIYEYVCAGCGEGFERRLRVQERLRAQVCPQCGEERAVLKMSVPARVGAGASASSEAMGHCPSTGQPCGCAHAIRN